MIWVPNSAMWILLPLLPGHGPMQATDARSVLESLQAEQGLPRLLIGSGALARVQVSHVQGKIEPV